MNAVNYLKPREQCLQTITQNIFMRRKLKIEVEIKKKLIKT